MCNEVLMYIFSLAFQIAGAVLLIIKFWGNTYNRIIETYYPGAGIADNDGDYNAILDVDRVRECAKEIYGNRAAFIYIAIGYVVSIFGEKQDVDDWLLLIFVIEVTIFLIMAERIFATLCSKYFYKADLKIPYDNLPEYVSGTMSNKDIDEMLEDTVVKD